MRLPISSFFSDITNFLRSGSVLGLDLGTISIKLLELKKQKGKFHVVNYGILETREYLSHPNQAIQTSSLKIVEKDAIWLLRKLVMETKPKSRLVVASLPAFTSFVTYFDMPLISKDETARSVMYQARQYIPIPISEVSIEWQKIEEFENQRGARFQRILLVGIPNEVISRYSGIIKSAGLKLSALELETYSLGRILLKDEAQPTLILDIGGQVSNIIIGEQGLVKYSSQCDYGGAYLTQAVSRGLEISIERAEDLKKTKGISKNEADSELSSLILPFLDVIIQECVRVRGVFEERYSKKVTKVIIVGGGSNLIGIKDYIRLQISLPVSESASVSRFEHATELEPAIRSLNSDFTTCAGLVMKYFE